MSELPNWARYRGAPWNETGHRLIVAMHGCSGAIETLHARCVAPKDEKGRDKAASPAGVEIRGSVMADPLAQQLLAGRTWPQWAMAHDIVITEGVPDFLTWASIGRDTADAPAVIGVVSGSWTDAIAARIPPGSRVVVRTHHDDAGNKYGRTDHPISSRSVRAVPECVMSGAKDDNDRLQDGELPNDPFAGTKRESSQDDNGTHGGPQTRASTWTRFASAHALAKPGAEFPRELVGSRSRSPLPGTRSTRQWAEGSGWPARGRWCVGERP